MTTKANCSPRLPQVFDGATKILTALQFWTAAFDPKVMRVKVVGQEKYAEKLDAAKQYLGKHWVLHPEYTAHPAHRAKDAYLLHAIRKEAVLQERI